MRIIGVIFNMIKNTHQAVLMSVAAFVFLCFIIDLVMVLAASLDESRPSMSRGEAWLLGLLGVGTLVLGALTLHRLDPIDPAKMPDTRQRREASDALFSRYLVGLGFFVFVDAVINMVAFAGFAHSGKLNRIFPLGDGTLDSRPISEGGIFHSMRLLFNAWVHGEQERLVLTAILALSLGMALLGALLFFAKSLWDKYESGQEIFDSNIFWAGLWFRLAEAITFTVAIFLFLRFKGYTTAISCLPMIALFLGLTVKSSENLVFGLAERLLASITSLVHPRATATTAPPPQATELATASQSGTIADFEAVAQALAKPPPATPERETLFKVAFASLLADPGFKVEYGTYFKSATLPAVKDRLENRWKLKIKVIKANLKI